MSPTAFVSGANGYIALHLVKLLISKNYKVIGSVRSEAKGEDLKAKFPTHFEYAIVLELGAPGAFDAALKKHTDVSVFFHTASPLRWGSGDIETYFLHPAINGVKNALKAVSEHGKNVERFVLTSSYAAIGYTPNADPNVVINEDTFTELTWEQALDNEFIGYIGSKTFGEKAAWEYVKNESPHFDLAVVNPTFVFGPQAFDPEKGNDYNASIAILYDYLKLKPTDSLPAAEGFFYDVRDVARAHWIAGEKKDAIGQRLFLNTGPYNTQLIADTLHKLYPQLKDVVPVGQPETTQEALDAQAKTVDSSRTAELLGFETISWEKSIKDTFDQIFASEVC